MGYSTQNDILQPILENGFEGFSEVLQKMLNLAMKLEREKVLKASPYQRTDGIRAKKMVVDLFVNQNFFSVYISP